MRASRDSDAVPSPRRRSRRPCSRGEHGEGVDRRPSHPGERPWRRRLEGSLLDHRERMTVKGCARHASFLNHRARSSSIDHAATEDRAGVAAVRQR